MNEIFKLWRGELPLAEAFWTWAVFWALCINITAKVFFLMLITFDQLWFALFVGFGVPVPYNLLVLVGVWRSAGRYDGPHYHADLARSASVTILGLLSVT